MENVVLIIHLLLALALIGIVLLQRSEGGGLGMGGGGGGGANAGRSAATAMTKLTWVLAACFICTSIALTIIAAQKSSTGSVIDRLGGVSSTDSTSDTAPASDLLLPLAGDDTPLVPTAD
jgi:preprotein translocase subunit SecG